MNGGGNDTENGNNNQQVSLAWNASSGDRRIKFSKFKGVISQQNGWWGAQIYWRNRCMWLGAFNNELDAAMAYDSAALKLQLRGNRNLPTSSLHLSLETRFQIPYSASHILSMIREGTYLTRLTDFCNTWKSSRPAIMRLRGKDVNVLCKDYFQKELMASDVGGLNRLFIPKRFAVKFLPHVDPDTDGLEINQDNIKFFDRNMRQWTFKYGYWNSSKSYVITKGWNEFVQDNHLKAKDVVIFCNCETKPEQHTAEDSIAFSIIDFLRCADNTEATPERPRRVMGQQDNGCGKEVVEVDQTHAQPQPQGKRVRLFGVDINY